MFYCLAFLVTKRPYFVEMKSSCYFLLLVSSFVGTVASKPTQTDVNKPVPVDDGKIVLHQIFNPRTAKADISSLRKEVEKLRKDLIQLLDKNKTEGKGAIC